MIPVTGPIMKRNLNRGKRQSSGQLRDGLVHVSTVSGADQYLAWLR